MEKTETHKSGENKMTSAEKARLEELRKDLFSGVLDFSKMDFSNFNPAPPKPRKRQTNAQIHARNERVFAECESDPNYIKDGSKEAGWRFIHVDSIEGKKIVKDREIKVEAAESMVRQRVQAVSIITRRLEDEDEVTKIQIRKELDKVGGFSVENLREIVKNLINLGIEVK